jgi:hypothetical protein
MWLTSNGSGGTVYAWGLGGTLPIAQSFTYNVQVGVTPMPIPLQNVPLLLNFGGANPSIQISWMITNTANYTGSVQGDYNLLAVLQQWGSSVQGYTLYVPELSPGGSTISVSCFLYQLQLQYQGGAPNALTASMTLYPGNVV